MKVVNYTELRENLKMWMDSVVDDAEELVITRKGQKGLVLISLEEYNSLKETQYLLSGENGKRLLKSVDDVKKGSYKERGLIEE